MSSFDKDDLLGMLDKVLLAGVDISVSQISKDVLDTGLDCFQCMFGQNSFLEGAHRMKVPPFLTQLLPSITGYSQRLSGGSFWLENSARQSLYWVRSTTESNTWTT